MPPVVLLTADRRQQAGLKPGPRVRPYRPEVFLPEAYVDAVRRAGGLPLVAPPGEWPVGRLLSLVDAVVLTGGDFDIHPSWYGEDVTARIDRVEPARTSLEIALARACLATRKPVLGVCGGMQALAVAAGGKLVQDVPKEPLDHEQPTDPAEPWHDVRVAPPASGVLGTSLRVNSTHHQAVRDAGSLVACGWAADGTVEVVASPTAFALGVQWHPEVLGDLRAYEALVRAAS